MDCISHNVTRIKESENNDAWLWGYKEREERM